MEFYFSKKVVKRLITDFFFFNNKYEASSNINKIKFKISIQLRC